MNTVLVTGATGFAGSHILEALMGNPDVRVIAACRDAGKLLPEFRGEVRVGDLRDVDYIDSVLDGVDVVCHAAAWSSLWGYADMSRRFFLEPSIRLIDKALESGVKRFIYASTTSAAAPLKSADPMSAGVRRSFWPHLCNVVAIEEYMRRHAGPKCNMVNLRLGIFAGNRYGLGVLPILLPRLKTHLVPWIAGGRTSLPLIDGRDIGQGFALATVSSNLSGYESFNIVGPEVPDVRQVIDFLHDEFDYPRPHFSVPFAIAYPFSWCMEKLDPVVPWEPLVTRSIVHLMEETAVNNDHAWEKLGYQARVNWQEAIKNQLAEMDIRQTKPMRMIRPII